MIGWRGASRYYDERYYNAFLLESEEFASVPTRAGWHAFLGSTSTGGTAKEPYYIITLGGEGGASRAYARADLTDGEVDAVRFAGIEGGRALGRKASGRYWQSRALDEFFSGPSSYVASYMEKLGIIWGPSPPSPNIDSRFMARYSVLSRSLLLPFAGMAAIGLVGLLLFTKRRSSHMLIFAISYPLLAAVYLVSDADKMLLVPFLAVFCGQVITEIVSGLRSKKPVRSVIIIAVVVIVAVLFSRLPGVPMNEARHLTILGDLYATESMFDKAEESYNEAIRISPDFSDARLSLAKFEAMTGKTDRAYTTLSTAIERDPGNPRLRIEQASLLIYTQRPAQALGELAAVEHSFPYELRLHQFKGMALMGIGQYEAAVEELEQELKYGGGDFVAYSALGRARFELGRYEEAASALETALMFKAHLHNTPTMIQLADCYTELGRHEEAAGLLGKIAAADRGNVRLRFKLGNALYRAGRYDEALRNFKEISKFEPRNTDILLNLGVVYAEVDSLDRAIETWERVLELEPDNETARDNLRTARE